MSILEHSPTDIKLYMGITASNFKVVDVSTTIIEDVIVPNTSEERLGHSVLGIAFQDSYVMCYQSKNKWFALRTGLLGDSLLRVDYF